MHLHSAPCRGFRTSVRIPDMSVVQKMIRSMRARSPTQQLHDHASSVFVVGGCARLLPVYPIEIALACVRQQLTHVMLFDFSVVQAELPPGQPGGTLHV
mmetsp:Transcript_184220/g.584089  ORF Transcript_184220/g.584089 Transcript_184220/m.584089 type:complete len:99 (-) Transcript_184220:20-316(-)